MELNEAVDEFLQALGSPNGENAFHSLTLQRYSLAWTQQVERNDFVHYKGLWNEMSQAKI